MKENLKITELIEMGQNQEAIELIEAGFDINFVDETKEKIIAFFTEGDHALETPLYTACRVLNKEMINYLLAHGANPNVANTNLQYPLEILLEKHYSESENILDRFLEAGVDLELGRYESPMNALMMHYFGAEKEYRKIMQQEMNKLITAGIRWKSELKNVKFGNNTILHQVAPTDDVDYMRELLNHEQSKECLDVQDNFGLTPLMYAAINGQKEMYELLLSVGADETITNKDGKMAKGLF